MTSNTGLTLAACFALSFVLWAAGVAQLEPLLVLLVVVAVPALLIGMLVQRVSTHPCPRCANRIANGQIHCMACGHVAHADS